MSYLSRRVSYLAGQVCQEKPRTSNGLSYLSNLSYHFSYHFCENRDTARERWRPEVPSREKDILFLNFKKGMTGKTIL